MTEAMIDEYVIAQADDEKAWTKPVRIRRPSPQRFRFFLNRQNRPRILRVCIMNEM